MCSHCSGICSDPRCPVEMIIQAGKLHHPRPAASCGSVQPLQCWVGQLCLLAAKLSLCSISSAQTLLCFGEASGAQRAPSLLPAPLSWQGLGLSVFWAVLTPWMLGFGCRGGQSWGSSTEPVLHCCLSYPSCAEGINKAEVGTKWAQSGQLHPGCPDGVNCQKPVACGISWGFAAPLTQLHPSPAPLHDCDQPPLLARLLPRLGWFVAIN